ncbi:MAG: hypothetical protein K9G76_08070 [Bacteroidales bacterium]|nr:hypothetical protein [Bacteroidales bacterium]MCF8403558.1 hypothetical protein [Bacteroidales bacterium]
MNLINEKLKKSCEEAVIALQKLEQDEYTEVVSKLEWCIGSYSFDKNPSGLHEYGKKSLSLLKAAKEKHPRKVSKKVIESLEKSISGFNQN